MNISALSSLMDSPTSSRMVSSIAKNRTRMHQSLYRLSSGSRLASAADAPADLAQSERLRSLITRYDSAISNGENAASYLDTSDGYMQTMQNTIGRMQELAVAANDGTKSPLDRQLLQEEFGQLRDSLNDITSGSSPMGSFNGNPLFQGNSLDVAIGPEHNDTFTSTPIDLQSNSSAVIGTDSQNQQVTWSDVASTTGGISIATQETAARSIEVLTLATDHLSELRAVRGAERERLGHTMEGVRNAQTNSLITESRIRDADMAKEAIHFSKLQTLTRTGYSLLANQTNRLLGVA